MSAFLRALEKVGLVEVEASAKTSQARAEPASGVSDADVERILAEDDALLAASSAPAARTAAREAAGARSGAASPPTAPGDGSATQGESELVAEGEPFESIYQAAQVPPSPYAAEKLLKVLEGLRAMEPATRKAAVLALDAADEDWTVDDAVLDAQRKARALNRAQGALAERLQTYEQQAQAALASQQQYQEQATASIRKQMAELEALLSQELEKVAQEKASIQARLASARGASAREVARYAQEIQRLEQLAAIFGDSPKQ